MSNIEQLKEINTKITILNQKRTQYIGAIETLKTQQKDIEENVKKDYNITVDELEKHIEEEKKSLEKEENSIIKKFTKIYDNPLTKPLISIQPPFTVDMIYREIQNNLLNQNSKLEAEINSLTKEKENIISTLKEEHQVGIDDIDTKVDSLTVELSELELSIQSMYNTITEDEELQTLLEKR